MKFKNFIILFIIFIIGLSLRLYGLNWDQGQHLHPDERFLTMVTSDIKLPKNIWEYFNTNQSPFNPYNYQNYQFFVYGTFPLFLTKYIGEVINLSSYDKIHFVGRVLSAIFDSLNIFLLYFITRKILKNKNNFSFLPSFFYAILILPIQLSHFFTVDTFLNFFILSTFTLIIYKKYPLGAISFGLALSCKISGLLFLPIIFLLLIFNHKKNFSAIIKITIYASLFSLATFRIFQPYAFNGININPKFINSLKQLQSYSQTETIFPPAVQWLSKTPLTNSFQNLIIWGVGLPLGLLLIYFLLRKIFFFNIRPKFSLISILFIWISMLFFYQGSQFAHTMRYFLPIYPFICILLVYFIVQSKLSQNVINIILFIQIFFVVCFLSIYSHPHSRVQASEWIYKNIKTSSKITNEYWDDPLPLYLPNSNPSKYQGTMLPLYDPDISEKWQKLGPTINETDYIIMSSNRLWGSIPLVPQKYPITSKFYQDLFDEKLKFKKIIEINSYPGISLSFLKKCYYFGPTNFPYITHSNSWFTVDDQCNHPGIYFRDDTAEEAFTVYDHPKVLIFRKQ